MQPLHRRSQRCEVPATTNTYVKTEQWTTSLGFLKTVQIGHGSAPLPIAELWKSRNQQGRMRKH